MRGREVTRLEGFSDAVFGFALTLLVVSLEVPEDFPALKQTLSGFLPFAATFAVVSWIWFEHYSFFLRFSLQDNLTVFLNLVLLFVVLFFAYPLKFVLTRLVAGLMGIGMPPGDMGLRGMTAADARLLMVPTARASWPSLGCSRSSIGTLCANATSCSSGCSSSSTHAPGSAPTC